MNKLVLFMLIMLLIMNAFPLSAEAKIIKLADPFDNSTQIISQFRDTETKSIKPLSQLLLIKETLKNKIPTYTLLINRRNAISGARAYSIFDDTAIRFNNDPKDSYMLKARGGLDNILGVQIALNVEAEVIEKIMQASSIELKIPLYIDTAEDVISKSIIYAIPQEVIDEWRIIIKQE